MLQKGEGYAIAPSDIPTDDYIVATEKAARDMHPGVASAMKAEIVQILTNEKKPICNLTREEKLALKDLLEDESITITPADKGKCLVVMDKKDYIDQMETKLKDRNTYREIKEDPTDDIKKELATKLKEIHEAEEISYPTYMKLYPSKTQIPRMKGQPKIHKEGNPLREIVDSIGSVYKEVDKHIAKIIKPLRGNTEYVVKNSQHFIETVKDIKLEEDETLVSYDVTALYPSVPQEEAIRIIKEELEKDKKLKERTKMTVKHIIQLFRIYVNNTYFIFNGRIYRQINGLAIGASTSGFAADIFMERLEARALNSFATPPSIWKRFVDDTFAKIKKIVVEEFLKHLNNLHPRIKFTTETLNNNKIAFLDTEINVNEDNSIKFKIYRKPTHTDQYLNFSSNHHIMQKLGIVNTFYHRSDNNITDEQDKRQEEERIKTNLRECGYPEWALKKKNKERKIDTDAEGKEKPYVVIPYVKGTSEKIGKIYKKYQVKPIYKPTTTLKNILCKTADKVDKMDKPGVVYQIKCKKHHNITYIGETERAMKYRAYEHGIIDHKDIKKKREEKIPEITVVEDATQRRSPRLKKKERVDYKRMDEGEKIKILDREASEVKEHTQKTQHTKDDFEIQILDYEDDWWKRGVKEAIRIQRRKPTLNQDKGRTHLNPIWTLVESRNQTGQNNLRGTEVTQHHHTDEGQPTGG